MVAYCQYTDEMHIPSENEGQVVGQHNSWSVFEFPVVAGRFHYVARDLIERQTELFQVPTTVVYRSQNI